MKIGILTFHRSTNYGAQLQTFALYTFLSKLGYNVSVVDYWPDYRKQEDCFISLTKMSLMSIKAKMLYIKTQLLTCIRSYRRRKKSSSFCSNHLTLSQPTDRYDLCIYGSDQIWRYFNRYNKKGFDFEYFGNGKVSANHRITYAASMGAVAFANTEVEEKFIQKVSANFDRLSVRESDLQKYLDSKGISSEQVCDPVFLLKKEDWNSLIDKKYIPKYKYIFYYNLQNLGYATHYVNELARKKGLKVIELRGKVPEFHYGNRYRITAGVEEFISLLSGAEFVVSSSFHGVALSLCLQKQFVYASKDTNSNRVMSLLSKFQLDYRRITKQTKDYIFNDIDYTTITHQIVSMANRSGNWLIDNIKNISDGKN